MLLSVLVLPSYLFTANKLFQKKRKSQKNSSIPCKSQFLF
jgi:hypothetical protein